MPFRFLHAVALSSSGGVWMLAGINSYVDGPFSLDSNGAGAFNASLFNTDGYYGLGFSNGWGAMSGPGMFYATRICTSAAWINSVVVPQPSTISIALLGGTALLFARRFRRR